MDKDQTGRTGEEREGWMDGETRRQKRRIVEGWYSIYGHGQMGGGV